MHKVLSNWEPSQNYTRLKGDMNEDPLKGSQNTGHHGIKFSCHGNV
jgi:hypothetical protein